MATLKDLKPSITQMTPEESFALIKETRFQRRQVPVKKPRKASSKKKPVSRKVAIASLTPEQRAKLILELEGL